MNKKILILIPLLFCISFVSCSPKKLQTKDFTIIKSDGSTVDVNAELAIKVEERNYGFMNRENIPEGTGMLFVFDRDQILSFWMKDTPHPLSIAYIDARGVIKDIFDMTPYSLSSIESTVSVRYALEVPQGWYEKVGVKEGDKLTLKK